jgi:hypothetical protein
VTERRADRLAAGLVALAILPVLVAAGRALARGWTPLGDNGLILLRAQDVGTSHHPLLGTWTSASLVAGRPINNPGPLWFDWLAPFVRLLGPSVGLAIGVAVANAGAIALAAWAARRAGGRGAMVVVTVLSAGLSWTMGSELLFDAWQPHAMILPCWALLMCLWALSTGALWAAPWAVGVASLLVQTHLSFVYVVAVVGVAAVASAGFLLWRARSEGTPTETAPADWRRPVAVSAGVAVLAWIQPVIDQIAGEGNLGALISSTGGTGERIGLRLGVRLVSSVVAVPPWWTRPSFSDTIVSTGVISTPSGSDVAEGAVAGLGPAVLGLVVVAGVLGGLGWWAWRRRDRAVATLVALAGVAIGACLLSMVLSPVNVIGLSPHQLRWLWPVAAMVTAAPLVAAARWVDAPAVVTLAAGAVATAVFVVLTLPTYAAPEGPTADRRYLPSVQRLLEGIEDYRPDGPVLFDISGLRFAEPYSGPVIAALGRQGVDVVFDDDGMLRQVGEGRAAAGTEDRRLLLLEGAATASPPVGAVELALVDGMSDAQRQELDELRDRMLALVGEDGLELNEAGRAARAAGRIDLPDVVFEPGQDATEFEAGGFLAGLIRDEWVVLDPEVEALARRYAELHERAATYTVGLFEAPVEPVG